MGIQLKEFLTGARIKYAEELARAVANNKKIPSPDMLKNIGTDADIRQRGFFAIAFVRNYLRLRTAQDPRVVMKDPEQRGHAITIFRALLYHADVRDDEGVGWHKLADEHAPVPGRVSSRSPRSPRPSYDHDIHGASVRANEISVQPNAATALARMQQQMHDLQYSVEHGAGSSSEHGGGLRSPSQP